MNVEKTRSTQTTKQTKMFYCNVIIRNETKVKNLVRKTSGSNKLINKIMKLKLNERYVLIYII